MMPGENTEKLKKITCTISETLRKLSGNDERAHFCSAIIVAAGSGTRMGGVSKQLLEIDGRRAIEYSLSAFQESKHTNEIIIVTRAEEVSVMKDIAASGGYDKVSAVVLGGETRVQSAENGFFSVSRKCEYVAIHDAARPLITGAIIDRLFREAYLYSACAAAHKVVDTVKEAGKRNYIERTIPREALYTVSTPQLFSANLYRASIAAGRRCGEEIISKLTDDCSLAENAGFPVKLCDIEAPNFKLTSPADLEVIESILKLRRLKA